MLKMRKDEREAYSASFFVEISSVMWYYGV